MAVDIGPKIGIDGESEFRKQLQNVNQSIKTLGSEMKAVTAEFDKNDKSVDSLTKQNDVLERTILSLNDKLELQKKALKESVDKYGEADTKTMKWQQAVNETTAELNKAERQYRENAEAMDKIGDETDETGKQLKDASKEALNFGDVLKANIIGDMVVKGIEALGKGIKKVGSALKDAVVDGAAFADDMLTLSTKTGLATDALQEYKYMSGLIDVDLDTITGSLAKLTKNMNTASKGTGDAAKAFKELGVNIMNENGELRNNQEVFNEVVDALGKMENETQRDAYAMSIFGKSAQELNPLIEAGGDKIAEFAKEAHDMGYVLDEETLNSLGGVQDAFDRFKNVTDSVKNNIASALAPTLEDLAAKMQAWIATVDWEAVGEKISGVVEWLQNFVSTIIDNGPAILSIIAGIGTAFLTWNVVSLISGLVTAIKAFQAANEGATIAQAALNVALTANPIGIVIAAVAGLVAAITTLWLTNEDFRNAVIKIWEDIKNAFVNAWEAVKKAWDNAGTFFSNIWKKIKDVFKNALKDFASIGKNIVEGLKEGINNAWSALTNWVKTKFQNLVSSVKNSLKIASPSKVFRDEVGLMMAKGVGVGFENGMVGVERDINSAMTNLVPSINSEIGINGVSASGTSSSIKEALAGAAVYMDSKKVGKIIFSQQTNSTRANGFAPTYA